MNLTPYKNIVAFIYKKFGHTNSKNKQNTNIRRIIASYLKSIGFSYREIGIILAIDRKNYDHSAIYYLVQTHEYIIKTETLYKILNKDILSLLVPMIQNGINPLEYENQIP